MDLLRANLDVLRRTRPRLAQLVEGCAPDPEVEVLRASGSAAALRVRGRLECSAERPEADGRALAEHFVERARAAGAGRVVLFGLGVHTLRFMGAFSGELLVVEPDLAVCRAVLANVDLRQALERVELLVGDDPAPILAHPLFRSSERGVLLAHPPARARAATLWDRLSTRFHPAGASATLDVAVVPPLYGGSLPVAHACASALRQLGHRVRSLDLSPFLPAYQEILRATADDRLAGVGQRLRAGLVRVIGETVLAGFEIDPPDAMLVLAQAPLDAHALERARGLGITRAFWFCEDFRVMTYWRGLAGAYDTIFHVQPDDFAAPLREAGAHGVPLAMAFDPDVHRPVTLTPEQRARYDCDLSFVGAGYHNRVQTLPALFAQGLRIYGTEWPATPAFLRAMPEPNARQSSEASNLIFNASRINLNLHSSPWCDGVNPVGDYLNPRTFELAGARAFQLVDERRDLPRAFRPGVEVETFRDLEECRAKIRYFGANEAERAERAELAWRRALAEHTYRHRMQDAVAALEAGPVPLVPRRRTLPTAGGLAKALRDEPEIARILERVAPDRVFDAAALTEAVQRGSGPLSREERMLLFMREARADVRVLETGAAENAA